MTTEERLTKLELQLSVVKRRNLWLVSMVVLIAGWMCWVQGIPGIKKVIHANEFVLLDENGKMRANLDFNNVGLGLYLYDDSSKLRAGLAVNKIGSGIYLYDDNGKARAALANAENMPGLMLFDENGKIRAGLAVNKTGPGLALYDDNGKVIWSARSGVGGN